MRRLAAALFVLIHASPVSYKCPYNHYHLTEKDNCIKCPTCGIGFGMNTKCNPVILYNPKDAPRCVPCVDGKSFSDYVSSEECIPCSAPCSVEEHEAENKKCTWYQDRTCKCKKGYFISEVDGKCVECCYCVKGSGMPKQKCIDDSVPHGKYCTPTRDDQKCEDRIVPTSIPPTFTTKVDTSTMFPHPATTFRPKTTARAHRNVTITKSPPEASIFDNDIVKVLCVFVPLGGVVVIGILCYRKRKVKKLHRDDENMNLQEGPLMQPPSGDYARVGPLMQPPSGDYARVGPFMESLGYMERRNLADMLDKRENGNWLDLGNYIARGNPDLLDCVVKCHQCYYGGGSACLAMFAELATTKVGLTVVAFMDIAKELNRDDIVSYINVNKLESQIFCEIDHSHKAKMADMLDRRIANYIGWMAFAAKFGFADADVNRFKPRINEPREYSPTIALIQVLIQNLPELTIEDVQEAAKTIDRDDVKEYLDIVMAENTVSLTANLS